MKKRIVIAGGSGFLGKEISKALSNKFEVIILTRNPKNNSSNFVHWDGNTLNTWKDALENAHAVINMAGKSVNCRYNSENKRKILTSRLKTTEILGEAINQLKTPPKYWINASTATIYRDSHDVMMTEGGELGDGFSVDVAKRWEQSFFSFKFNRTAQVALRISIVLGNEGGALPELKRLVKTFFGGKQGHGNQYISWIHIEDLCGIINFILESDKKIPHIVNCSAPNHVTNAYFMERLRSNLKVHVGFPLSRLVLKLGAFLKGTETELILKSRRVYPGNLLKLGYNFKYSDINTALTSLKS